MGRGRTKRDPDARQTSESYFAWQSRLQRQHQEERDRQQPLVTAEAEQHGEYSPATVMHVETATRAETKINRGGTPLARWTNSGALTQSQLNAIQLSLRLWRLAGNNPKVTATYGPRVVSFAGAEHRAISEIEARQDLHRIIGYFPGPLRAYYDVYENICRHDMPAGVAGSELARTSRSGEVRAHQVVCFVADFIAMKEGLS